MGIKEQIRAKELLQLCEGQASYDHSCDCRKCEIGIELSSMLYEDVFPDEEEYIDDKIPNEKVLGL